MILYQEAAKSNLLDWSEKWPLSPVPLPTNNLTCEAYCKAVEVNAKRAQPLWRITKANFSVLEQTHKRINQRATELYNTSTKAINHDPERTTKDEKVVPKEKQQQKEQQEKEPNEKQNDLKEKILAAKEKAAAKILAAKERAAALALKKQNEQRLQQVKESNSQEEDEEGEIDENMDEVKTVPTPVMKSDAEQNVSSTKEVKADEKEDISDAGEGEEGEIGEEMEDGELTYAADDTMVSTEEQNEEKVEDKTNQTETPESTPTKPVVAGRTTRRLSGNNNLKTTTTTTNKTPVKAPVRKKGTAGKPLQTQSTRGRGRGRGRGGVASRA